MKRCLGNIFLRNRRISFSEDKYCDHSHDRISASGDTVCDRITCGIDQQTPYGCADADGCVKGQVECGIGGTTALRNGAADSQCAVGHPYDAVDTAEQNAHCDTGGHRADVGQKQALGDAGDPGGDEQNQGINSTNKAAEQGAHQQDGYTGRGEVGAEIGSGQLLRSEKQGAEYHQRAGEKQGTKLDQGRNYGGWLNKGTLGGRSGFNGGVLCVFRLLFIIYKQGQNGGQGTDSGDDVLGAPVADGLDEGGDCNRAKQAGECMADAEITDAFAEFVPGDNVVGRGYACSRGGGVAETLKNAAEKRCDQHGNEAAQENADRVQSAACHHNDAAGQFIREQAVRRTAHRGGNGIECGHEAADCGSFAKILRDIQREDDVEHLRGETETH